MAKFFIRQTINCKEYWDNINKKIITVPVDEEPDFEVQDDLKSLVAVDISQSTDMTVLNGKHISNREIPEEPSKEANEIKETKEDEVAFKEYTLKSLKELSVAKLKELAKKNDISIPGAIRAKDDVIQYMVDNQ